jgi:Cu2+-containing amine oxidase
MKHKYNQGDIVRYQFSFDTHLLTIIEVLESCYRILWSKHHRTGTVLMDINYLDDGTGHKLVTRAQ